MSYTSCCIYTVVDLWVSRKCKRHLHFCACTSCLLVHPKVSGLTVSMSHLSYALTQITLFEMVMKIEWALQKYLKEKRVGQDFIMLFIWKCLFSWYSIFVSRLQQHDIKLNFSTKLNTCQPETFNFNGFSTQESLRKFCFKPNDMSFTIPFSTFLVELLDRATHALK